MNVLRRSRTSQRSAPRTPTHDVKSEVRLLARVIRTLVSRRRFTTYDELKDAVYRECYHVLRIKPVSPYDLRDAIQLIESNADIVTLPPLSRVSGERSILPDASPRFSKAEASALLVNLGVAVRSL